MVAPYDVSAYPGAVVLLLITGVAAILFAIFMLLDFIKNKKIYHLLWALSFLIVFIAGVLLVVTNDYSLLLSPLVAALAALIPGGIAAGLYFAVFGEKNDKIGLCYLLFVIVMVVVIGITKVVASPAQSIVVMIAHIPSSLSIILIPLYTTFKTKDTDIKAILVSIGGLVISAAGVMLAFLTAGSTIFTADLIFTLLPIVLLLSAVFFALGMLLPEKWTFGIPGLKK
jgi:hypothetical protein